jgi:hypothetical protein
MYICHQIYIQKYISIFQKINFHEKHQATVRNLSPNKNKQKVLVIPYYSLDHCVLVNFFMFKAKDVTRFIYHFQSLSFDATSYPQTS